MVVPAGAGLVLAASAFLGSPPGPAALSLSVIFLCCLKKSLAVLISDFEKKQKNGGIWEEV